MAAILIVDDESALAELVGDLLVMRGETVSTAINGLLGLARLRSATYDLVISDIMMPIMTGLEMVTALRADPALAKIPVIMTSAQGLLLDEVPSDGFVQAKLLKPYPPRVLYALVDRLLGRP